MAPESRPEDGGVRLRRPGACIDLSDPRVLLGIDDSGVQRRIAAATGAVDPHSVEDALRRAFSPARAAGCTRSGAAALALAADVARAHVPRPIVLAGPGGRGRTDTDMLLTELRSSPQRIAGIVLDPLVPGLEPALAAAHRAGVLVVADATEAAFRIDHAAAPVLAAADLVCVGESLAGGLPFGAMISRCDQLLVQAPEPPAAAALAAAHATLAELANRSLHAELALCGRRLEQRIQEFRRRDDLAVELVGQLGCPAVEFAGQEGAGGELMLQHFRIELATAGLQIGERLWFHAGMLESGFDGVVTAFDRACARMRTLLIEHNSYLSGGIAYAFAGGEERLRERGIAQYRFPKHAAVTVEPVPGGIRVAFAPEHSKLTSSGFYVPTRLRGDFDISVTYEIRAWRPGPDGATFALFVQNEPSTARYYAQRTTPAGDAAAQVLAVLGGAGSAGTHVSGNRGGLRLTREGSLMRAWHRTDPAAGWDLLGEDEAASRDDVIAGAKIWSTVRCDGLEVWFTDLQISATIPDDQLPRLEPRPDPRSPGT